MQQIVAAMFSTVSGLMKRRAVLADCCGIPDVGAVPVTGAIGAGIGAVEGIDDGDVCDCVGVIR